MTDLVMRAERRAGAEVCREAFLDTLTAIIDPVVYSKPWSSDVKRMKLNREKAKRWDEQIYCVPSEEFPFQRLIQSGNIIEP